MTGFEESTLKLNRKDVKKFSSSVLFSQEIKAFNIKSLNTNAYQYSVLHVVIHLFIVSTQAFYDLIINIFHNNILLR